MGPWHQYSHPPSPYVSLTQLTYLFLWDRFSWPRHLQLDANIGLTGHDFWAGPEPGFKVAHIAFRHLYLGVMVTSHTSNKISSYGVGWINRSVVSGARLMNQVHIIAYRRDDLRQQNVPVTERTKRQKQLEFMQRCIAVNWYSCPWMTPGMHAWSYVLRIVEGGKRTVFNVETAC